MELWKKNSAEQITSPSLWKWDFEYEYNPDFDLGMGEWISNGDNDEQLQQGKQTDLRERAVTLSLDLLQKLSALTSSYPRRKHHLQSPVTILQFLLMSKTHEKALPRLKPANTEASTRMR